MSDNSEGYDEAMKRLLLNCDRRAVWLQPIARKYGIDAKDIGALISDVERKEELYSGAFGTANFSRDFPEDHERIKTDRRIIVNGREKRIVPKTLSYNEIVKLAFDGPFDPPIQNDVLYTVAYFWQGYLSNEQDQACIIQGILSREETLQVYSGMKIDVSDTSNA